MTDLAEGDKAPQFILPSSMGGMVSLKDYRGKINVVLFFYEKDMIAGCIREACGFRDLANEFETHRGAILGISPDDMDSHRKFVEIHRLNYPLLSDSNAKVSERYGVYVEKGRYRHEFMAIQRTTFVIDKRGSISKIFTDINVDKHPHEVLEIIKKLNK